MYYVFCFLYSVFYILYSVFITSRLRFLPEMVPFRSAWFYSNTLVVLASRVCEKRHSVFCVQYSVFCIMYYVFYIPYSVFITSRLRFLPEMVPFRSANTLVVLASRV